jgi:hypothetical protein
MISISLIQMMTCIEKYCDFLPRRDCSGLVVATISSSREAFRYRKNCEERNPRLVNLDYLWISWGPLVGPQFRRSVTKLEPLVIATGP